MTGPSWSGRAGRVAQVDEIIQFGENSFVLLAGTRNHNDRKHVGDDPVACEL